ncbi:hypothetical protein D3C76_1418090 [compost metagenome]
MDILVRVLGLKEQQLGNHQVGHVVLDLADQENHPLFQQARIDIVGTLATGGLLDHHRHQAGSLDIWNLRHERIMGHVRRSLPYGLSCLKDA